jgi:hypothetical protein
MERAEVVAEEMRDAKGEMLETEREYAVCGLNWT